MPDALNIVTGSIRLLAATLGMAGYALFLRHRLRTGNAVLDSASLVLLTAFLASTAVLVLGIGGLLQPLAALLVSAPGWALLHRALLRRNKAETQPAPRPWTPDPASVVLVTISAVFTLLVLVRAGVYVWYLPPYVWDSLTYHLPRVAEWIQHESLVAFPTPVSRSYWPANHELLQAWLALFLHHDALVDAANLAWYLLAVLSVFVIVNAAQVPAPIAMFSTMLFALTPAVLMQSTSTNTDIAVAAQFLFVIALACDWRVSLTAPRMRLVLAFTSLCLAVGTKPWIAFVSPGLAIVVLWCWLTSRARSRVPAASHDGGPGALVVVPLLAAAALLAVYWYGRNAFAFGNPVYPASLTLFGHTLFAGDNGSWQQGAFSLSGLVKNLEQLVTVKITDLAGPYVSDLNNMTGWGWFAFGPGLASLAWAVAFNPTARWLALAFGVSLCSLLAWVTPDDYNMRFAIWFPALFSITFGLFLARLRLNLPRLAFIGLATLCAGLNFLGTMNVNLAGFGTAQWHAMASLPVMQRSAAALRAAGLRGGDSFADALAELEPGYRFGYHVDSNGLIYPLYDADFSRHPVYVPLPQGTSIAHALDARDLDRLFVWRADEALRTRLQAAIDNAELVELSGGLYERTH